MRAHPDTKYVELLEAEHDAIGKILHWAMQRGPRVLLEARAAVDDYKTQRTIWNGKCRNNKHGLDYFGQRCDLCPAQTCSHIDQDCVFGNDYVVCPGCKRHVTPVTCSCVDYFGVAHEKCPMCRGAGMHAGKS